MSTEIERPNYYAKGHAIFQRPITTPNGTRMGFMVCTVSEDISGQDGRTGAEEVARLLNLGDAAKLALVELQTIKLHASSLDTDGIRELCDEGIAELEALLR